MARPSTAHDPRRPVGKIAYRHNDKVEQAERLTAILKSMTIGY